MARLNRIQLIGRLGVEPETKTTSGGRQVCTFRLAVDRSARGSDGKNGDATDWFNIEAWGRLAEICQQYLHKGRLVFLEGRLQTDRYEQDGQTRYYSKVVLEQMQMLDRPSTDQSADSGEREAEAPEAEAVG